MRQRDLENYLFGPGENQYSTLTIRATGELAYSDPSSSQWVTLADSLVNGFIVSPWLDSAFNYAFSGGLVLRIQTSLQVSSISADIFLHCGTRGSPTPLPCFGRAYRFALYALSADQNLNVSVNVF